MEGINQFVTGGHLLVNHSIKIAQSNVAGRKIRKRKFQQGTSPIPSGELT